MKIKIIKKQIEECAKKIFGSLFEFRPHQLEAITILICKNLSKNVNYQIMNAPTGSGKSIIGILTAEVLWKYYKKTSYILVSDLSLFEQYVNDIEKNNLKDIGYLKGKDNYICNRNFNKVNCSACSINNISISKLVNEEKTYGYKCKETCEYIKNYKSAINSPITLMTYQLYFIQRNYVADDIFNGENKNFPIRDLVICDEAHKLCDIVQNHFSPNIEINKPTWEITLDEYAQYRSIEPPNKMVRKHLIEELIYEEDNEKLIDIIKLYEQYISFYAELNNLIRAEAKCTKNKKFIFKYLICGNLAREVHCKLDDLLGFISYVKNVNYFVKTVDNMNITINYIFEETMLKKYFHLKNKNELLMSATIGDYETYLLMIGLKKEDCVFLNMTSTFDFSKSPIYISSKNKMSWKEKHISIKNITKDIIHLLKNNYKSQKGIIQTGNYENARYLYENIPKNIKDRMIFYFNSKDKLKAIEEFKKLKNAVLIGPTLLEGLNFPGDECRFLICVKLPYANLSNKLVEAKKNNINNWYSYDVMTKLEQGIGRGIRYNGDWCITHILDGCIVDLLKYNKFNKNLENRLCLNE